MTVSIYMFFWILGDFESISNLVKREKDLEAGPQQQPGVVSEDLVTSSKGLINLVKDPHVLVAEVPDFFSLSDLFNQGGINISQEETYRIFQALKKVEQTSECKSVRFFGKMFGTGADYYIIESERNTIEEQITVCVSLCKCVVAVDRLLMSLSFL